jgi:hypothetical protein
MRLFITASQTLYSITLGNKEYVYPNPLKTPYAQQFLKGWDLRNTKPILTPFLGRIPNDRIWVMSNH